MATYVESTISLAIQIVVLGLLIGAVLLKNQKKYRNHGLAMLSAVVLHILSIIVVMVPSSAGFFGMPSSMNFADALVISVVVHIFTGILAAFLGVWLVSSWHLQKTLQTCFKKKRIMDATLVLWLLAIALGIILYLVIVGAF